MSAKQEFAFKKPSWTSVYRWVRSFIESNKATDSLLTAHRRKGNRTERFPVDVTRVCEDAIDEIYMTEQRPSVDYVLTIAKGEVRRLNQGRPKGDQLPMPSRRLLLRLISEVPARDRDAARYGAEAARAKYRSVLRCPETGELLLRGEIDHTRLNILVIDQERGIPLGRPWLTVLIEVHSRCILGFYLGFEPPSRASVAQCLRHAFVPKGGLRELYPDLKNDWVPHGVVSELVVDGGQEFHSPELSAICFDLGCELIYAPRKTPWMKGKVERFNGTLNRAVTANAPGKTFEGILDRADYDPVKHAVLTLHQVREVIVRWIVDVYHQKTHRGLGCSPQLVWNQHVPVHDIPVLGDPTRMDAIVGARFARKLTHAGVLYDHLFYNSVDLLKIRESYGAELDVDIRVNRSNLGSIIVLHPERQTPIRVPALRSDYAEGLTEWQHKICRNHHKKQMLALEEEERDVDGWIDSMVQISELIRKAFKLRKAKGATAERMARWAQGKQAPSKSQTPDPVLDVQLAAPAQGASDFTCQPADALNLTSGSGFEVRKQFKPIFEPLPSLVAPQQIGMNIEGGNHAAAA